MLKGDKVSGNEAEIKALTSDYVLEKVKKEWSIM